MGSTCKASLHESSESFVQALVSAGPSGSGLVKDLSVNELLQPILVPEWLCSY